MIAMQIELPVSLFGTRNLHNWTYQLESLASMK
jgi:hypothetical protein